MTTILNGVYNELISFSRTIFHQIERKRIFIVNDTFWFIVDCKVKHFEWWIFKIDEDRFSKMPSICCLFLDVVFGEHFVESFAIFVSYGIQEMMADFVRAVCNIM